MLVVYIFVTVLVLILLPEPAFAWGPGMHVEIALTALAKSSLLLPVIRELIKRYPDAFIYGATSPDIIVGKKYAGYFHHCHNWRMGWQILHDAKSDHERAAAYGYLMHLAADIVAHNYYIPVKIVRSYSARLLSHTYWEMRFDLGVDPKVWDRLKVITKMEIEGFDSLLERVLKRSLFSFSTSKKIFNTILILQKMGGMRKSLNVYAKYSRFNIGEENRKHYIDLTYEAAIGFLRDPENSECLSVDPVGEAKLKYARKIRRRLRLAMRLGSIDEKQATKCVELVKERLAIGLYRPEMKLPRYKDLISVIK